MRMKAGLFSAAFHLNRQEEQRDPPGIAWICSKSLGLGDVADEKAVLPALRQAALSGDRPGAGHGAAACLLLDEPAAGMNPQETDELSDFIRKIKEDFKLTVFLIEHHMNLVMGISRPNLRAGLRPS